MKNYLIALLVLSLNIPLWGQTYQNAESVEYDASQNRFLVSNGNNMLSRASDGTLSFFGIGGTSHGLEVLGDHVFGLSGNVVKGFNLATEDQVMTLTINGASFLNGLTSDGGSNLYATDFSAKRIYKINVSDLSNPVAEVIVNNTIETPNGIIYDGDNNQLIFVTWGNNAEIRTIDLTDNSMSTLLSTGLGSIDGIDEDNDKNYYISSWSPNRITKYDVNFENPVTITVPGISSPADICYAKEIDTLGIPQGNSVDYIGFEIMSSTETLSETALNLTVVPNPVKNNDNSWIQFELESSQYVELSIVSLSGQVVTTLMKGQQLNGQHKVILNGIHLKSGIYFCVIKIKETETTGLQKISYEKIVVL